MNKLLCRKMVRRLSEYIDGELDASICDRFDEHLADCAPCVRFIETLRKAVRTLKAAGPASVPAAARKKLQAELRRCAARVERGRRRS